MTEWLVLLYAEQRILASDAFAKFTIASYLSRISLDRFDYMAAGAANASAAMAMIRVAACLASMKLIARLLVGPRARALP